MFIPSPRSFFSLTLCFLVCLASPLVHAQGKKDAWLKKTIPLLKPTPFTKSSIGQVQGQMIRIISVVERSDSTDGPKPNELITRACESYPDYGPVRTMVTANVIEKAYEDAKYLGLFDKKGKFRNVIKNGPNVGGKIQFEYIVPPENGEEFSQDIANIRIVTSKKKRQSGTLDRFDLAHLEKLKAIKLETRKRLEMRENEVNHLLDTSHSAPDKGPHYEKWEAAMKLAGDAANETPQIKLEARKNSTASSSNGEKMSVRVKLSNYTKVPTKVTVHCFMLGRTDIKRVLFKIGHAQKEVVLLPKDKQQMILYSPSFPTKNHHAGVLDELPVKQQRNGKFSAQGWVVRVEHKGDVVANTASMMKMIPLGNEKFRELNALP